MVATVKKQKTLHAKGSGFQICPLYLKSVPIFFIFIGAILLTGALAAPAAAQNSVANEDIQTFRIYPTDAGDTLRSIAGQKDVLRDPLKWILLYRLNRDELARLRFRPAQTADASLPAGMNMIFISPEEAGKQAVRKAAQKSWVVNLYSGSQEREIEALAVRLADECYNPYISRVSSKKNNLLRLRAGFFPDQNQAAAAGRRMIELLGLPEFWVVQAQDQEILEFSGYAD